MKPLSFLHAKSAAVLSGVLCLPFVLAYASAVYDLERFIPLRPLLTVDGYAPTTLGRVVMLGMLMGLPLAFLVNLLPMIAHAHSDRATPFQPTPTHTAVGMSTLFVVLLTLRHAVLYELRPFVALLGAAAPLGQVLYLAGLSVLPVAFLLNRLPRLVRAGSGGRLAFQPTSVNLIIGAAILLAALMLTSAFMLETIACSSGVPNCD